MAHKRMGRTLYTLQNWNQTYSGTAEWDAAEAPSGAGCNVTARQWAVPPANSSGPAGHAASNHTDNVSATGNTITGGAATNDTDSDESSTDNDTNASGTMPPTTTRDDAQEKDKSGTGKPVGEWSGRLDVVLRAGEVAVPQTQLGEAVTLWVDPSIFPLPRMVVLTGGGAPPGTVTLLAVLGRRGFVIGFGDPGISGFCTSPSGSDLPSTFGMHTVIVCQTGDPQRIPISAPPPP